MLEYVKISAHAERSWLKEVPKQLCFLKLDQSRLSQNQVQNLENMIQANKNYLESILCGAQTIF